MRKISKSNLLRLKKHLGTLRFLSNAADTSLYIYDVASGRVYFTDNFAEKYGLPPMTDDCYSIETLLDLLRSREAQPVIWELQGLPKQIQRLCQREYWVKGSAGELTLLKSEIRIKYNRLKKPVWVIGRLQDAAAGPNIDALTGLLDREKMAEDISACRKSRAEGFLTVFGIDNLRNVNTRYGRGQGNQILKTVAATLEKAAEGLGTVYRLDSDKFAIHLSGGTRELVEQLYRTVQSGCAGSCTLSAGAAEYSQGTQQDAEHICLWAESALNMAKEQGKNMLVFFSPDTFAQHLSVLDLQEELQSSVANGCQGFFLLYQPQIRRGSYQIFGTEALLRFQSPSRGLVGPDIFMPILEQTGMIVAVGAWVLEQALSRCRLWREALPELHISVNVSYAQLKAQDAIEQILGILERSGVPGSALTLELTESMQLQDFPKFNKLFSQLNAHGVKIAIDDFGTGYSNLSYLKRLSINEVKIDQCFVSRIQHSAYNSRLLHNIIELAHSANIRVCCEGVETEEELRVLQALQPDLLQGYLFARACDPEQFEARYIRENAEEYVQCRSREEFFRNMEEHPDKTHPLYTWLDLHHADILEETKLGLWVIRLSPDGQRTEMYADRTMRKLLGIEGKVTPEECYNHWYSRINEGYFHYVNYSVQHMIDTKKAVELRYTWNHPEKGAVTVRCLGIRAEDSDGMICLKGYHRDINDVDMPQFLPDNNSIIFEYNENKGSVYFHSSRKALAGSGEHEENFPACWLESGMVHPHFVNQFRSLFTRVRDQREQASREFLLRSASGDYEWYRLQTRHLGQDDQDADTVIVILNPASQERAMELEFQRQSSFYRASLSEKIAYAEIDMESHRFLSLGGLWSEYADERHALPYDQVLMKYAETRIHPDDQEAFRSFIHESTLHQLLAEQKQHKKIQLRRRIGQEMRWVELTGHVFQDPLTDHSYALMYLRDIDADKRREAAQERAATRDALTNILNRSAFEEQLTEHISQAAPGEAGTLLMFDLDYFKEINDTFGHMEGDRVLQEVSQVLGAAFRHTDLIGRFGGDEFLVFLKGTTDRDAVNRQVERLRQGLSSLSQHPVTCSIGAVTVRTQDFSYSAVLRQADDAMYRSKAMGRNTIHYYETAPWEAVHL